MVPLTKCPKCDSENLKECDEQVWAPKVQQIVFAGTCLLVCVLTEGVLRDKFGLAIPQYSGAAAAIAIILATRGFFCFWDYKCLDCGHKWEDV